MTQPDTLHTRLRDEIDRRLAVARAAAEAKPGDWSAVSTHDGTGYDGLSRVLATQRTVDRTITRHVADGITDVPEPVRTSFADADPPPAVLAEHIALHDPADAVRRYEGELEVLERHQPWGADGCSRCTADQLPAALGPCDEILSLAHRLGVSVDG